MIYLWFISNSYPEKYIGIYDHDRSPDYLLYREGQYVNELISSANFKLEKVSLKNLNIFNCIQNSGCAPLVDKKTRDILDDLNEFDVQYFDAIIECKDGISEDFKIVNITNKVLGIDHGFSEYSLITGTNAIRSFKHLALKKNCLQDHVIARDKECLSNILVSQKLVDSFKKNKIKGVKFITAEEYNNISY